MSCVNRGGNVRPAGSESLWRILSGAVGRKPRLERAAIAEGPGPPAAILPEPDDQGVVLVVQTDPARQRGLESPAQGFVALRPPDDAVAEQDPPGVGVDDEGAPPAGI